MWTCIPLLVLVTAHAPQAEATPVAQAEPFAPVPLPRDRHGHRLEALDGGWLCFGGFGDPSAPDRETKQAWWLARGATEWTRRADMATGRAFFASCAHDGKAFAIGEGIERFDAGANRWDPLVPAGKLPRSHFAAAAVGGTLYVHGGYGPSPTAMWAVDLTSGALRETPPPPGFAPGDHFHLVHAIQGKLHVLGGFDGESFEAKREHWRLDGDAWHAMPQPPAGMWSKFAAQAVVGPRLYAFGDFGSFVFDASAGPDGAWTTRDALPGMVVMPQWIADGDRMWLLGGMAVDAPERSILWRYEPKADRWFEGKGDQPLPPAARKRDG